MGFQPKRLELEARSSNRGNVTLLLIDYRSIFHCHRVFVQNVGSMFGLNDSLSYGHLRKDTSIASSVCLGGVKTKIVST